VGTTATANQEPMTAQPSHPMPAAVAPRPAAAPPQPAVRRLFGELDEGERIASLLDLDPDLGEMLDPDTRRLARRRLLARVRTLPLGEWQADSLMDGDDARIGALIVDGIVLREVLAADVVSTELLGPGDVIRPWQVAAAPALLEAQVRWNVVTQARIALLDGRVAQQLGQYPSLMAVVVDRVNARAERLAVERAIAHLKRVDQRLLAMFWHFAERWGRVTPDGIALPLTLPHRLLAQLIGARRPTVSTALGQLAADGSIVRRRDGTWLLSGAPFGRPEAKVARFVPPRRRFVAAVPDPPPAEGSALVERFSEVPTSTVHVRAQTERERAGELRRRRPRAPQAGPRIIPPCGSA
jgi:CRP/FNR family transcriptional regulator, cyclic AMP receptor protein